MRRRATRRFLIGIKSCSKSEHKETKCDSKGKIVTGMPGSGKTHRSAKEMVECTKNNKNV